jgi:PEP-CTERM motif
MKWRRVFGCGASQVVVALSLYLGFGLTDLKSDILLDVSGSPGGTATLFRSGNDGQWLGQQWSFTQAFRDVSISAGVDLSGVSGEAWLMNAIGPTATAANVLETVSFDSPGSGTIRFFNNLDLQPGAYFFLLTVNGGQGGWHILTKRTVAKDPLVDYDGYLYAFSSNSLLSDSFPPASRWNFGGDNLDFLVTGSPALATVPEPSTLPLLTLGFALLAISISKRCAPHDSARCIIRSCNAENLSPASP